MYVLIAGMDRVARREMTRARFESMENMYGLNANPHGVLADPVLRPHINPISTLTYDWVHNCLQDGTFTLEASEFLRACEPHGVINCLCCVVDVVWLGFRV